MNRNLKTFGVALAAVLAMGALSASTAMAASFHSEQAHTILSGEQPAGTNDVISLNAGSWTCQEITYSGTTPTTTNASVTVTPAFRECTAFGFINIPIDVNKCTYTFGVGESLQIKCPGSPITTTAFNCHIKIGTQTIPTGVTYDNAGSGISRDVTVTMNLSGLEYTQEGKSFPACSNGTFTNGTYKGSGTVKGTTTVGGAVGIWHTA